MSEVDSLISRLNLSPGEALDIACEVAQDGGLRSLDDLSEEQRSDFLEQLRFLTETFIHRYDHELEMERLNLAQSRRLVVQFRLSMPTTPLPDHLTKISYILLKKDKAKVEKAAKRAGLTLSELITQALETKGILKPAA